MCACGSDKRAGWQQCCKSLTFKDYEKMWNDLKARIEIEKNDIETSLVDEGTYRFILDVMKKIENKGR